MTNKITMRNGRVFATNNDGSGVFELICGSYLQHRGNDQAFKSEHCFRRYVQRMLRGEI